MSKAPKPLPAITILDAMDKVFPQAFSGDTWQPWRTFLSAMFGLPMTAEQLEFYQSCTGRTTAPTEPSNEAYLICGRRAGKSRVLALICVYLAVFKDWSPHLSVGERGTCLVLATDRRQARVIMQYVVGLLESVPALASLVNTSTAEAIELSNNVNIQISTASFRAVRGHSVICALLDEVAFFRESETSANPDREILDALRPAMATIPGSMLLGASSPYARRGVLWDAYRRYHGQDGAPVLTWKAATRVMNSAVPQRVIDEAIERDPSAAAAEFGAEFRTDIESFVSREVVDGVTVPDRRELPYRGGVQYKAFVDPSGGSADSMTLAIAHTEDKLAVLDVVREVRPPFGPDSVTQEFAELLKSYRIHSVTGDRYAGEWPRERFRVHGIQYELADKPCSDLYRDLLPILNSGQCELLDHPRMLAQLIGLERRTARGGRDSISHAPSNHDDIINSVAGALLLCRAKQPMRIHPDALAAARRRPTPIMWAR